MHSMYIRGKKTPKLDIAFFNFYALPMFFLTGKINADLVSRLKIPGMHIGCRCHQYHSWTKKILRE